LDGLDDANNSNLDLNFLEICSPLSSAVNQIMNTESCDIGEEENKTRSSRNSISIKKKDKVQKTVKDTVI